MKETKTQSLEISLENAKQKLNAITGARFQSQNHLQEVLKNVLNNSALTLRIVPRHTHTGLDYTFNGHIYTSGQRKENFVIHYIRDNGNLLFITEITI